jgi:hypothetical protein
MTNKAAVNKPIITGIRRGEFEETILDNLPAESLIVVENRERISP